MALPGIDHVIQRAAQRYGIDPGILRRQLVAESGLNPNARSPKGAQGIAQFIPSTARGYGVNLNDGRWADDVFGAAHYMRDNLNRAGGSYAKALSIYNSGRPDGYLHIAETRNYVNKILGGSNPKASPGGGTGATYTPGTTTTTGNGFNAGNSTTPDLTSLISSLTQPAPPPVSAPTPPASALSVLKPVQGFQASSSAAPVAKPDIGPLLSALQASSDTTLPSTRVTTTPGTAGVASAGHVAATVAKIKGVKSFDGKPVAGWIAPILSYARSRGWKGSVTSGYRSVQEQAAIYNRGVRPAAKPGQSNHNFTAYPGGAIDVTDAQQLSQILQGSPYARLLVWAGSKDPVHFSKPHNGSY